MSTADSDQQPETSFARLLREYMWAQRPPLTAAGLARNTGIAKQTIWNWLNGHTLPQPATLAMLSQHTDIPLVELVEAVRQSAPATRSVATRAEPSVHRELEELLREVEGKRGIPYEVREKITSCIEEAKASYTTGAGAR